MGMTGQERKTWLSQISRIHFEQKRARTQEVKEQTEQVMSLRAQEQEAGLNN